MFRRESTFALDDIFLKDWKEVKQTFNIDYLLVL